MISGLQAHTDFECFTILRQDDVPSALQVQNRKGQCEWHPGFLFFFFAIGSDQNFLFLPLKGIDAPYMPDTFVINIGDQFARWTSE